MKPEQFCKKHNISIDQFNGTDKIGGYLDLGSVTTIPDGFNPTVGGDLYLGSVTTIPDGFNPTVGGDLYYKNKQRHIGVTVTLPIIELSWQNGKYKKIDGIFCEMTHERPRNFRGFEVFRLKKVNRNEFLFLAKKDNFYSHGSSISKAIDDLRFKMMADKVKNEPIKKDTIITRQYYRIITGACELGVTEWMKSNNVTKEEITAEELLPLLEKSNAYGLSRFKSLITF